MKTHTAIEPLETRIAPAVIFAVEAGTNKLVSFDSAAPGTLLTDIDITGLNANEVVTSIDFDQVTGTLYGVGIVDNGASRTLRGLIIAPATGTATQLGNVALTNVADVGEFGMDVASGALRITNSADGNIFVLTGNVSDVGNLTTLNDPATNESITGLAYSNSFAGGLSTAYAYNFSNDNLVTIGDIGGSPQDITSGVVKPVADATLGGAAFATNNQQLGFDIAALAGGPELGWLSLNRAANGTHLYTMDLATAALTDLGAIGGGTRVFGGLAVQIDAAAPAISTDQKTATWTDLDGDAVTLKITKGTLTAANFRMLAGTGTTSALAKLTLTDPTFTGTNITLTAKPGTNGGDGRVNVGVINATGVDLGAVKISGDLVAIDAGTDTAPAPSVKSLAVASMAAFGRSLLPFTQDMTSSLADGAGKITIAGDFAGNLDPGLRKTGSITIGGDMRDAGVSNSGRIAHFGSGSIGKIIIKGSVRGGESSGSVSMFMGPVGSVFIGGSIIGGDTNDSGRVSITGSTKATFTVVGSVIGGAGPTSGSLQAGSGFVAVKIGGSLIGGSGADSGSLDAKGAVTVSIGGDVRGGAGVRSAGIDGIGSSQSIFKTLTVGGSIISGDNPLEISAFRIGTLAVKGSILGSATAPVTIAAQGNAAPANAAESIAIGKATIGGSVAFARIVAGVKTDLSGITADAAIGAVKIGGNFIASSIAAGINPVNGVFGDGDDAFVGGNAGNATIIAKIASITIGGQLLGTSGGAPDSFGILAEEIGSITVNKVKPPLTAAKDDLTLGFTADVRIREL